jgi:hypothetical protein
MSPRRSESRDISPVKKIVSGGQTGVDRAALDFAIENGILHGGWCPKGRRAEDGKIPAAYDLKETASGGYGERTGKNVEDSDGTLVIYTGKLSGGTLLTAALCRKRGKPLFLLNTEDAGKGVKAEFLRWIEENEIETLNVAGKRGSEGPIYRRAIECLRFLLDRG